MEWTTALSLAARAGKQGYDHRHLIQKYWTRAKAYIDLGATQIVVTGHAGAGKTQLTAQMHGRARELAYDAPGESRSVEVFAITAGSWSKLVRVIPGQDGYRTKGSIEAFQDNKNLEGVIHLVDFGYVSPRDTVIADSLVNVDGLTSVKKLRDRNLRLELENLRVLLTDVRRTKATNAGPKWIAIAVNKVDLYPTRRNDALQHYHPSGTGEFGKMLSEFQKDVGSENIAVYVLQACAYEKDFEWNGGIVRSALKRQEQDSILVDFTKSIATICEAHK